MNRFFRSNLRANLDGLPGGLSMRALFHTHARFRTHQCLRFELENSRGKKPHWLRSYAEVWW